MEKGIQHIQISSFLTRSGLHCDTINLGYQLFGCSLGTAPIVVVNHALTGNSQVTGESGWWNEAIGEGKVIDTCRYTIIAFNVPGNGYGYNDQPIDNYQDFTAYDIAKLFLYGLEFLGVDSIYGLIGGSVGGGIAWEMAAQRPLLAAHLIPVASDWKSTDWLIANCLIQEQILNNSSRPVHDARLHAMLCYRTPQSFKEKFGRSWNETESLYNIETWLLHHGKKLQQRFQLSAYKLMNKLLQSINIEAGGLSFSEIVTPIKAHVHIVAIDSDLFFTPDENRETYRLIKQLGKEVSYHEINSIHGHDAFLIEFDQLETILKPIFVTNEP